MRKIKNKAFTLIELLVVIAIISILATLLLLQLGVARAKARDAKRIADVNQVRSALELYFDDQGKYVASTDMTPLTPTYLINIPKDPLAAGCTNTLSGAITGSVRCYDYAADPAITPTKMQVSAELEQSNRNALQSDGDIPSTGWAIGNDTIGATETCTTAVVNDCIYDAGQN